MIVTELRAKIASEKHYLRLIKQCDCTGCQKRAHDTQVKIDKLVAQLPQRKVKT